MIDARLRFPRLLGDQRSWQQAVKGVSCQRRLKTDPRAAGIRPSLGGQFSAVVDISDGSPEEEPDELRERAVRLYREADPKPVIRRLAEQLGVHHEALRNWIRQTEADSGERHDRPTTAEAEELRRLRMLGRDGGGAAGHSPAPATCLF